MLELTTNIDLSNGNLIRTHYHINPIGVRTPRLPLHLRAVVRVDAIRYFAITKAWPIEPPFSNVNTAQ